MKKYEALIQNKFIVLPINMNSRIKKLSLFENGELLFDFDAHIDFANPHFYTYMNVERFIGKKVEFKCKPEIELDIKFADNTEKPDFKEEYRPLVHFSTDRGWINDPNGLVKAGDRYHLFFQHNPVGTTWGNMTWGHAVSNDLVHWEELDGALHPDSLGTMFSGSAIVDKDNRTGLKENENDVILLYYTAAGNNSDISRGKKSVQCLAYSTDNGESFKKYAGNPIIDTVTRDNRDPKVIFAEELDAYLLALFLDGDEYALFRSDNLIDWQEFQRIHLAYDGECPDFYPLNTDTGERRWVFSGASDRYLVGELDRTSGFVPTSSESKPYLRHGRKKTSYAAQTFSNTGSRRIKLAWEVLHAPNSIFENQMSVPLELSLKKLGCDYYLSSLPVKEFETLRVKSQAYTLSEPIFKKALSRSAYDIEVTLPKSSPDLTLSLFGHSFSIKPSENTLSFADVKAPLSLTGEDITLRFIFDTLGCEIFADCGLVFAVAEAVSDYGINSLSIASSDQSLALDGNVTVHTLSKIR